MSAPSQLRAVLVGFGYLAIVISINTWAFRHFGNISYLGWYLKEGAQIALGASFIGLVWEGLALRTDLLSAHPAKYVRGCFGLLSVFFHAVSVHLANPLAKTNGNVGPTVIVGVLIDSIVSLLVLLVIAIVVISWLLVIAPLNYFLTLLTGALARQELRGQVLRAIVVPNGSGVVLTSQSMIEELPKEAVDVSIARSPFALTQAINSLILWIVGMTLAT